jgi:nitric oxide reductase subunit B
MAVVSLFPVGVMQLYDALAVGYWHARSQELYQARWVRALEWLRLPGDVLFIVGGAVPLVILCVRAIRHPSPHRRAPGEAIVVRLSDDEAPGSPEAAQRT